MKFKDQSQIVSGRIVTVTSYFFLLIDFDFFPQYFSDCRIEVNFLILISIILTNNLNKLELENNL